ncbi:hypothetical protein J6590_068260 [Homalodisca vitripennis]|nr:hypothetical protein J6590_068260 [Homalodisca vitripennis]
MEEDDNVIDDNFSSDEDNESSSNSSRDGSGPARPATWVVYMTCRSLVNLACSFPFQTNQPVCPGTILWPHHCSRISHNQMEGLSDDQTKNILRPSTVDWQHRRVQSRIQDLFKNTMTGLPVTLTLSDMSLADELDLPIKIVEENINKVFQEYQCDESVGFSHCISADLNDERNMSAGIARMFKEKFGRPSVNDCINSHLTCQKTAKDDYNLAFRELIQEFKKRGLKKLICSPMGCVRDETPPEHFVIKIIEFYKISGASVDIITYDEHASRRLRGGLSYSNFVKKLRDSLSNTYQQGERTETDPLSDALDMATTTGIQADVEMISADDLLLTTPMPSPLQLYRNLDEVQCVKSKAFNEVPLLSSVSHICADITDSLSSVNKQLDQTPAKNESPLSSPFFGMGLLSCDVTSRHYPTTNGPSWLASSPPPDAVM